MRVSILILIICLLSFTSQISSISRGKAFVHFSDFAKFVLLKCSDAEFPLITFFTQIILILPFATADCENTKAKFSFKLMPFPNKKKYQIETI